MIRSSLLTVCFLIFFPPSLLADGVHSFTYRADNFSNNLFDFTAADHASDGGDSAFFVSGTFGSNEHHLKWLDDPENDHGEAWGWRGNHHHNHHDGDDAWNFVDQGNEDTDGDSGNGGSTSGGEHPSTSVVPEPSVLVLLSTALAAFLLKSLRSATD